MTSTILEKTETKKVSAAKKPPMSYADALDVIQSCDVAIKKAADNRISHPESVVRRIQGRNAIKIVSASGAMITSMFVSDMVNIIDSVIALPVGALGACAILFSGMLFSGTEGGSKVMSPLKYRAVHQEVQNEMALFTLKEQEFAAIEAKVLKKAKKAMKVINENVAFDNREISYSNTLGQEGFEIVQTKQLSAIETEKLRLKKMETDAMKALEATGTRKELSV